MLRDSGPLDEWVGRENPDDSTWRRVAEAVFLVGERPWATPSIPLTLPTGQPTEIREIAVDGTSAVITYEHEHASGIVDLLRVDS
jgi:hypothetical protein